MPSDNRQTQIPQRIRRPTVSLLRPEVPILRPSASTSSRRELFGDDYVNRRDTEQDDNKQASGNAAALNGLGEDIQGILGRLDAIQDGQNNMATGVERISDGVDTLQSGQYGIGGQVDNFKRQCLNGIGALADRGGSWLDNCFPPRTTRAVATCLKDLILLFVNLYIFFVYSWFHLCNTILGLTGTISGSIPILGCIAKPITQAVMIIILLWISTFVMTLFAFNTVTGSDQIIYIIWSIRQFMAFIYRNIDDQIANMRLDLEKIAEDSGLSSDYEKLRNATDVAMAETVRLVRDEAGTVAADAFRNLPGNAMGMAKGAAQGLGNVAGTAAEQGTEAIGNVATGVKNMFGNMFGHFEPEPETNVGGGKRRKMTKKRRHKKGGDKKDDLIKINELTNYVLKETGLFFKYILAVQTEITWLYLNTNNQGREKLNKLFIKYPISIKFNNGLVKMFTKSSGGILSKMKRDTENKNPFHVDYIPLVNLLNKPKNRLERAGIKGGKQSKRKSNRKKKSGRKNKKQGRKTRRRK